MWAHGISRKSGGPCLEQRLELRQLQRSKKSAPEPHCVEGDVAETRPPDVAMASPAIDALLPTTITATIKEF